MILNGQDVLTKPPSDTLELEGSLLEGLVRFQQAAVRD